MQTLPPAQSLRRELQDAPGFSAWALLLAILGSVAGTVITSAFGTGHWGVLAGAAVGPVVSTTFSTQRTGEKGGVRNVTIAVLSACALFVTITGFTFADHVAGKSVLPGPSQQSGTFFGSGGQSPTPSPTPSTGSGGSGPALQVQPSGQLDCGTAAVGAPVSCSQPVTITSTGGSALQITNDEVTGPDAQDFIPIPGQDCAGTSLAPAKHCDLQVRFQPTAAGQRQATLVIHQNLPAPDQGTAITLTGTGTGGGPTDPDTCVQGFVWRDAFTGDHVCVTPATRAQAAEDDSLAASRRSPDGGAYGPDTCLQGFVWRGAIPSDHVCVTPATRDQTAQDNSLAATRRVGGTG